MSHWQLRGENSQVRILYRICEPIWDLHAPTFTDVMSCIIVVKIIPHEADGLLSNSSLYVKISFHIFSENSKPTDSVSIINHQKHI